jgi:hypothetical protein
VFSKPEIKSLLDRYVIVELYTDKIPPTVLQPATSAEDNKKLQDEVYKDDRLPLYVILGANGQEIARYEEGKINNVGAFAEFLRKPLNGGEMQVSTK